MHVVSTQTNQGGLTEVLNLFGCQTYGTLLKQVSSCYNAKCIHIARPKQSDMSENPDAGQSFRNVTS